MDENMMHHHGVQEGTSREYAKFALVILSVLLGAFVWRAVTGLAYAESLMGVFFTVFAGFKLSNLRVFAYGFQSYDLLAKKSLKYAFIYPYLQLTLGLLYLINFSGVGLHLVTLIISLVSGAGVLNSLLKKAQVHCVCLGNVIKLPLSRISFVEDFGMAIMAAAMLVIG